MYTQKYSFANDVAKDAGRDVGEEAGVDGAQVTVDLLSVGYARNIILVIEVEGGSSPKGKALDVPVSLAMVETRILLTTEVKGRSFPTDLMRDWQVFLTRELGRVGLVKQFS